MSQTFHAASVATSTLNMTTNNTQLVLSAGSNEKLTLNLSPLARQQLLQVLLVRPHNPNELNVLPSNGVRCAVLEKAIPVLEFSFGNNMAIPVSLPVDGIQSLKAVIADLEERLARNQSEKH